jgi:hypothetical protein
MKLLIKQYGGDCTMLQSVHTQLWVQSYQEWGPEWFGNANKMYLWHHTTPHHASPAARPITDKIKWGYEIRTSESLDAVKHATVVWRRNTSRGNVLKFPVVNRSNLNRILNKDFRTQLTMLAFLMLYSRSTYEGWSFNSGNYLFTTDTK